MREEEIIFHMGGLQSMLYMAIACTVFLSVLVVFDLRNPNRKNQNRQQRKGSVKLIVTTIFLLGFVVFYANVNLNPRIVALEGTLVRRVTGLFSYEYYFDIGKPMMDKALISTSSASEIVPENGLYIGSRYRYYYEERTGEIVAIERIASE